MIKRELKVNLKSFIIWLSVLILMYLFVYLLYPFILNDETISSMEEMMKAMPSEMMKAFNMDAASIATAYGWFKTEGLMFILLICGIYSSIFGGSILLKEENDKTIEYLNSLPVKRSTIVTNKIIVGLIYSIAIVVLLGIFNYVSLMISGDLDQKQFLLLSITPLLATIPLFAINLFISTLMHKSKVYIGISLGMTFFFYFLNVVSEISTNVEFLKYFSIFTLADSRNIITNTTFNPIMILISLAITLLFIFGTYVNYNKKELVD